MAKALNIAGIVLGFLAGTGLVIAGIVEATGHGPHTPHSAVPGKLIVFGIAALLGSVVATIDGTRVIPTIGMWNVGAKYEGLGDLAVIIIALILVAGAGISFAV